MLWVWFRIIVGPSLSGDVSDASVEIFHHDTEYGLSLDEALEVSDRYAVGVVITGTRIVLCTSCDMHMYVM